MPEFGCYWTLGGTIGEAEVTNFFSIFNGTEHAAIARGVLALLDKDGSGEIDAEELVSFAQKLAKVSTFPSYAHLPTAACAQGFLTVHCQVGLAIVHGSILQLSAILSVSGVRCAARCLHILRVFT